jgi:hypothetical protein
MIPCQNRELLPKGEILQKEVGARSKGANDEQNEESEHARHASLIS